MLVLGLVLPFYVWHQAAADLRRGGFDIAASGEGVAQSTRVLIDPVIVRKDPLRARDEERSQVDGVECADRMDRERLACAIENGGRHLDDGATLRKSIEFAEGCFLRLGGNTFVEDRTVDRAPGLYKSQGAGDAICRPGQSRHCLRLLLQ